MTKYNENNFFELTAAVFDVCETPDSEPDYVSGSGSAYWYVNGGVVRCSDHWGYGIASCKWYLRDLDMRYSENVGWTELADEFGTDEVSAFCSFEDFMSDVDFRAVFDAGKREHGFKVNFVWED